LDASAEFNKIAGKTALGFILMGFVGFFVKLIFIVSAGPGMLRCGLTPLLCSLSPLSVPAAHQPDHRRRLRAGSLTHSRPLGRKQQPQQHVWTAA
jgi:hypothetical protein